VIPEQGAIALNQSEAVTAFLRELDHPMKAEIISLREAILAANDQLSEHIKWKAPSFRYGGDDRVTFNLRPQDRIQLVFHRGAKVRPDDGFVFVDPTGLLNWAAPDRATLTLRTLDEVRARQAEIVNLVNAWVESTT
jgi:hypothetical protein